AFLDGAEVFLRDDATDDLFLPYETGARLDRLDTQPDMTILATTTRLTHELAFLLDRLANRFTVRHLRRTNIRLDVELALHAINDDIQVQLAHTGNNGLSGLLVRTHAERRVLLGKTAKRKTHLFLVCLGSRFHRNRNNRLRELHTLQDDRRIQRAQRFTGGDIFHADARSDIARADFLDLFAIVGVHLQQATDTLLLAAQGIQHRVAAIEYTGINANKGQGTDEGIRRDLERQCGKWFVVGGVTFRLLAIRQLATNRFDVIRRRQIANHGIQHCLDTLVLERRATKDRNNFTGQHALADRCMNFVLGQRVAAKVLFHELIVCFGGCFDQLLAPLGTGLNHLRWRIRQLEGGAHIVLAPPDRLVGNQ